MSSLIPSRVERKRGIEVVTVAAAVLLGIAAALASGQAAADDQYSRGDWGGFASDPRAHGGFEGAANSWANNVAKPALSGPARTAAQIGSRVREYTPDAVEALALSAAERGLARAGMGVASKVLGGGGYIVDFFTNPMVEAPEASIPGSAD